MRDTLFAAFTPEELLRVVMLPQFPEAPGNRFIRSGRNLNEGDEGAAEESVACTSGFIVNMQEMTVRLETPCPANHRHPTGERLLEKCAFSSAADLEAQIRRMISQYMPEAFEADKRCSAVCDFRLLEKDDGVRAFIRNRGVLLMPFPVPQAVLDTLPPRCGRGALPATSCFRSCRRTRIS